MANLNNVTIKAAAPGRLSDGRGLILIKASSKSGSWVFRYQQNGRRRDMGLGAWPDLTLAQARAARDHWAAIKRAGEDPISFRETQKEREKDAWNKTDPTLAEMVTTVFEARKASLRGDGKRGRWRSPLDTHILPKLGTRPMSKLNQYEICDVLRPIWKVKHPTAQKVIQRLRIIFREAKAVGVPCDPFVAEAAERMLGIVRHETAHIPATPWQEIPALFARLDPSLSSHQCLRWMILTLVRSDGCRGARLSEITDTVWTVPADRVKGTEGRVSDFRVPLSEPAMQIALDSEGDLIFPGTTMNAISSTALEKALNVLDEKGRPHGFRSSFRAWVQDTECAPWDVAEMILDHTIGTKVERTYARSDLLERRRPVMEAWAKYVTGSVSKQAHLDTDQT